MQIYVLDVLELKRRGKNFVYMYVCLYVSSADTIILREVFGLKKKCPVHTQWKSGIEIQNKILILILFRILILTKICEMEPSSVGNCNI